MTVKRKNLSPGWSGFLFGIGLVYFSLWSMSSRATDAGLINNGVQQYFDNSGNPLTSGKVYFYEVGTSTFKDTYTSSAATTINQNPITLNAGGKAPTGGIYGVGLYRQLLKDRNGNVVWDAVTSPGSGGGSTPTDVGDGNLVGTVLPWSGLVAPNQYVFAYGQELSRTTYPEFYTAVTLQANVICSASSNTLTGIADTTQIPLGAAIELSLCVIPGTTVVSKTAATVTLSNPSSVSINAVATFFPFGNGNGTTTFNVPDLRGYVIAGRNNMGGTASARLTSTYYGTDPNSLYGVGGSQTKTITQANLPNVSFTNSGITLNNGSFPPGLSFGVNYSLPPSGGTTAFVTSGTNSFAIAAATSNVTVTSQGTAASGGTDSPFSIIQPTATLNYVVKITPDTSTSIATGVYSIGGMTGVISCGTGILCTGNIISFNGSVLAGGVENSIQYRNPDGSFGGSANALFISPNNLTLGAAGTSFLFDIFGSTSGRLRQTVPAVAGTTNIDWGNSSGTPAVTATTPIVLNTTTGDLTCPTCATSTLNAAALTRTNDTNVTVTLGGSPTTALLNAASLTLGWTGTLAAGRLNSNVVQAITNDANVTGSISAQNLTLGWTGQLAVDRGGTGLSAGTSGGIPYFNSSSTMASSGVLGANQIVLGGGAGAAPTSLTCSTSTTVVHGGSPPSCSQIVAADIATNTITNSNLAQVAARTVKGNPTASTANVQDVVPATARSSSLLNIDQLTTIGDANYSILNTDRSVFTTTTLSTTRTWTLPAANTVNAGQEITIWDAAGAIISPNNLTIARTGADTINGGTSVTVSTQRGGLTLKSDGVSAYTYVPQASGGGGGGSGTVTSVICGGGLSGGTITSSGTCANINVVNVIGRAGSLDVFQRGAGNAASIAVAASTTAYTADGWYLLTNATQASVVSAQTGIAVGSFKSAKVLRNSGQTGTGVMRFAMPLDIDEVALMAGNYVAMSFTAKAGADWSPASGTINYTIYCGTTATAAKRGATPYTGETTPISGSTTVTTTAARVSATSAAIVPTSCAQAEIQFNWTPVGTAGADDSVDLDDVQVEVVSASSSAASPFVQQSFQQSLARNLPFYQKSTSYNTAPQTAADSAYWSCIILSSTVATGSNYCSVQYSAKFRATPTTTVYPYTTTTNTARSSDATGTDYAASSAITNAQSSISFVIANSSGGALTIASQQIIFGWFADASI